MPRGDGTGPIGYGSMTGRRAGFCAGFCKPGYYGLGRGHRRQFYATGLPFWARGDYSYSGMDYYKEPSSKFEIDILTQRAKFLKEELELAEKRLKDLKETEKENSGDN
ncbi:MULTISPECIES: DUF5320 domain-containing protein [Tepidanaerobacter]|uniref:DUF5320 domain-containing protein n=1 Tax=Tepidanaerobacter TaxID=499228 RepID=UPI000A98A62F|nr:MULTISPECIES: DUF5320 domain-containing protein [Tepidanaerobacter]GLI49959.1 hypothetical protein TSYNTROOL_00450 [Tepidanaerobacter syntrophicus]